MPTEPSPRISDAEWEVMKVLWQKAPRTSKEVADALSPLTGWKPNTVKTLLQRLLAKGVVTADSKQGREFLYAPAVDRDACVRSESKSLVQRLFGGSAVPMIAGLLESEKLTPREIASIRELLDAIEKKNRK